jgi:hypothetical protein
MKIIETQFNEILNADQIERINMESSCDGRHITVIAFMKSQEEVTISSHFKNIPIVDWPLTLSEEERRKCVMENKRRAKEDYELCLSFLIGNDPFISFEKFDDFGPVPPPPNGK